MQSFITLGQPFQGEKYSSPTKYIIVGGEGGLSELLFRFQSYSFGHSGPHTKFQNRSLPASGLY